MSFQPSSLKNLAVANSLRSQGFANLLDAQPAMRDRFVELWHSGNSIKASRVTLAREYRSKNDNVPSQSALQHYASRYLRVKPETVAIEPYTPDYTKLLRKYDPVVKAHQIAIEAEKLYVHAVKSRLSVKTQSKLLMNLMKVTDTLDIIQRRSGIARNVTADNWNMALNMQQNNVNINVGNPASGGTEVSGNDVLERFERMRALELEIVNNQASLQAKGVR